MAIAAVIQMNSSAVVADNLQTAQKLLEEAARGGAVLAALPENFALMALQEQDKFAIVENEGEGPIQEWLATTARNLGLWIIAGTMPIRTQAPSRAAAACLVVDANGRQVARYDKIHLFDVDVPGKNESYRESTTIVPGELPVVIDTPIGRMGLAVCYDMRFPELFRGSAIEGRAQAFCIPAAFTVPTGQAHWDVLLRARAIENLSYVLAPAQVGRHANGRETYGNAMIVGPWGDVLGRVHDGPGIALAEIDLATQVDIRGKFPALTHCRLLS